MKLLAAACQAAGVTAIVVAAAMIAVPLAWAVAGVGVFAAGWAVEHR